MKRFIVLGVLLLFPCMGYADLVPLDIWTGNVGVSISGVGSNNTPVGNLDAVIPVGAEILAAYLYSAGTPYPWYSNSPQTVGDYNGAGITLAGNAITNYDTLVGAVSDRVAIGQWYTGRADVTDLIKSLATSGPNYSWSVTEGSALNNRIDGEVLAIVYSDLSLPEGSVVFLDGGQDTGGETTTVNLVNPLGDVSDPSFFAQMGLAISFSTGSGQISQIDINGTRLTSSAGGLDDGAYYDGGLLTVGGIGDSIANPADPYSSGSSSYDDELYNLVPFLSTGDTSFSIFTENPSDDDNIFFMSLYTSAEVGSIGNGVIPEPSSLLLLGTGLGVLGLAAYRRRKK